MDGSCSTWPPRAPENSSNFKDFSFARLAHFAALEIKKGASYIVRRHGPWDLGVPAALGATGPPADRIERHEDETLAVARAHRLQVTSSTEE